MGLRDDNMRLLVSVHRTPTTGPEYVIELIHHHGLKGINSTMTMSRADFLNLRAAAVAGSGAFVTEWEDWTDPHTPYPSTLIETVRQLFLDILI